MSKILRQTAKIFGSASASQQIAVFGSLAAGSPQFAGSDVAAVQSFGNWAGGWPDAVLGLNSPAIEDLQAYCYVTSYQEAYLLQQGMPEYDGSTTYFQNSVFQSGGSWYSTTYGSASGISGQAPPNGSYYELLYGVSPYNPGSDPAIIGYGPGSTARPTLLTNIAISQLPPENRVVSSSCGSFSTSTGSAVLVTNLSNSITTHGRSLNIQLQPAGGSAAALFAAEFITAGSQVNLGTARVVIDGVVVASWALTTDTENTQRASWSPSMITLNYLPSAGAHTVKVEVSAAGASATVQLQNLVLYTEEET